MNDKPYSSFGVRLRGLRTERGLTQAELVERLEGAGVHVAQSYLSDLERDTKTPNAEIVARLARVLNTSADYLLLLTDEATPPQSSDTLLVITTRSMKERQLLEEIFAAIYDLPPEEQQLALGAVEIVRRASLGRLRSSGT